MFSFINRKPFQSNSKQVEAEGFYLGSQGADPKPTQQQIVAESIIEKQTVLQQHIKRIKPLEAMLASIQIILAKAHQEFCAFLAMNAIAPNMMKPFLLLLLASLCIVAEPIFIAPALDSWGVRSPVEQIFLAIILSVCASGLLETLAVLCRQFAKQHPPAENDTRQQPSGIGLLKKSCLLILTALHTAFCFLYLAWLGYWRAQSLIFAGSINTNVPSFAKQHPDIITITIMLAAIGLPIVATVAIYFGFEKFLLVIQWRMARRRCFCAEAKFHQTAKKIEALTEINDSKLKAVEAHNEAKLQAFAQQYQLGANIGAIRPSRAKQIGQVVTTIVAAGMMGLIIDEIIGVRFSLYSFHWGVIGLIALAVYLRLPRLWSQYTAPSAQQLFKNRGIFMRQQPDTLPALRPPTREERDFLPPLRNASDAALTRNGKASRKSSQVSTSTPTRLE